MTFLIVLAIACVLFAFLVAPNLKRRDGDAYKTKYYAHRGLHDGDAPENSLAAFEKARDAGYGVELDVQMTKDGTLVVFHDDALTRMCGVEGTLSDKAYDEIRSLRLLDTEEKIPLFSEVLDRIGGRIPLLIELKNGPYNRALVDEVLKLLSHYRGAYLIESFSPLILHRISMRAPHILRGQLVGMVNGNLKGLARLFSVLLHLLMANCLSRPDFVAYAAPMGSSWQISLQRRLFRVRTALWTIRSASYVPEDKNWDIVIFEDFRP